MKKSLLSLFLYFVCAGSLIAQFNVYHPFPDSNAYWKEQSEVNDGSSYTQSSYGYLLTGDTVISGKTYCKVNSVGGITINSVSGGGPYNMNSYYASIREDSFHRVYIHNAGMTGNKDSLLYDFNLKVGDTLRQFNSNLISEINYVIAIDSVSIEGNYRKQFVIACDNPHKGEKIDSIIEGIGSVNGLVDQIVTPFEDFTQIVCFKQNGIPVYGTGPGYFNDTCKEYGVYTGIVSIQSANVDFIVYPNPASTQVTLSYQLPSSQKAGTLQLYNAVGQLIRSTTINETRGTQVENVSALPNGIYYYTLSFNGMIEATNKLVIIH